MHIRACPVHMTSAIYTHGWQATSTWLPSFVFYANWKLKKKRKKNDCIITYFNRSLMSRSDTNKKSMCNRQFDQSKIIWAWITWWNPNWTRISLMSVKVFSAEVDRMRMRVQLSPIVYWRLYQRRKDQENTRLLINIECENESPSSEVDFTTTVLSFLSSPTICDVNILSWRMSPSSSHDQWPS